MTENGASDKPIEFKKFLYAMALVFAVFLLLFIPLLSCSRGSSSSHEDSSDSGYSSNRSSYSSGNSYDDDSSDTLLDEDDWVDTEDGKTFLKSEDADGGTSYIDTDGDYAIHKNSDGTGAIADSKGNVGADTNGDGSLDSLSLDGGDTWIDLD